MTEAGMIRLWDIGVYRGAARAPASLSPCNPQYHPANVLIGDRTFNRSCELEQ